MSKDKNTEATNTQINNTETTNKEKIILDPCSSINLGAWLGEWRACSFLNSKIVYWDNVKLLSIHFDFRDHNDEDHKNLLMLLKQHNKTPLGPSSNLHAQKTYCDHIMLSVGQFTIKDFMKLHDDLRSFLHTLSNIDNKKNIYTAMESILNKVETLKFKKHLIYDNYMIRFKNHKNKLYTDIYSDDKDLNSFLEDLKNNKDLSSLTFETLEKFETAVLEKYIMDKALLKNLVPKSVLGHLSDELTYDD